MALQAGPAVPGRVALSRLATGGPDRWLFSTEPGLQACLHHHNNEWYDRAIAGIYQIFPMKI